MNWIISALASLFGWGCADVFYKKGSDPTDRYSHLKIGVWVGLVLGLCAIVLFPFSETLICPENGENLFVNLVRKICIYFPASLSYIISMIIGYAGLRYLEVSVISPVQNSSGVLSSIVMVVFFMFTGKRDSLEELITPAYIISLLLILSGIIFLAVIEKKLSVEQSEDKKYRLGALALIFPILYCVFDTIGTSADGIILNGKAAELGEIDVLVLYGLTFFAVGLGCFVFLIIKTKTVYNPFRKHELPKAAAAGCEAAGQVFYIYAMAANPVYAAPIISAYCIVSLLLSRLFLKEKLKLTQYICIFMIIAGIILLG